jgi:hypothetical protein
MPAARDRQECREFCLMAAALQLTPSAVPVLRVADIAIKPVSVLLGNFGLQIHAVAPGVSIDGSHWGDSEAGLIENRLYVRADTPLHSVLHEAAHYICMDDVRRTALHTDAGGSDQEENAVCYLQILLADEIKDCGRARMMQDMDAWGYTFRLGSARAWFEQDAEDARVWLCEHGIIDMHGRPTEHMRI